MRGIVAFVVLVGLLMCVGCFTTGTKDVAPAPPPPAPKLPPAVTADQITAQNPHSAYQALVEEMDREEQKLMGAWSK